LLRLFPPHETQIRRNPKDHASPRHRLGGTTGGVCKEQGRIHRVIVTRDYWGFHVHEGELQPSIPTTAGFRDFLPLSGSAPSVPAIAARVWPGGFGAY